MKFGNWPFQIVWTSKRYSTPQTKHHFKGLWSIRWSSQNISATSKTFYNRNIELGLGIRAVKYQFYLTSTPKNRPLPGVSAIDWTISEVLTKAHSGDLALQQLHQKRVYSLHSTPYKQQKSLVWEDGPCLNICQLYMAEKCFLQLRFSIGVCYISLKI